MNEIVEQQKAVLAAIAKLEPQTSYTQQATRAGQSILNDLANHELHPAVIAARKSAAKEQPPK